jgi:hypothetical protein
VKVKVKDKLKIMSSIFQITLSQQAKSFGGDKYLISSPVSASAKESFIYVPQRLSRSQGKCTENLTMFIRKERTGEPDEMEFELLKNGKTGDDRYKSTDEVKWKGDIYLPQELRSPKIYVSITTP